MKWKLRIPLMLCAVGVISGFYQYFPSIVMIKENALFFNLQFFVTLTILYLLFEKSKINEKKVHYLVAFLLILVGAIFDQVLV